MYSAPVLNVVRQLVRVARLLALAMLCTLATPSALADGCEPRWSALEGPGGVGTGGSLPWVYALAGFDDGSGPALYAGGLFTTAGGVTVNGVARWSGSAWSALEGPGGVGVDGQVRALAVFDDGSGPALYVGGSFTLAGGVTVHNIARWNGSRWSALAGPGGVGVSSWVNALEVFDDGAGQALYVGGDFFDAGGVTANRIARWDGHSWSALTTTGGVGVSHWVSAFEVFDDGSGPALYVGGWFGSAGGVPASRVAHWNGATWTALAGPGGQGVWGVSLGGIVYALTVFDAGTGPALYVGGDFETAGGETANGIARWDGSDWSALTGPGGTGVSVWVQTLAAYEHGPTRFLYAGGLIQEAGGLRVNGIARWDGGNWSPLQDPSGEGANGSVDALAVLNEGSEPALYVGGSFTTAGGLTTNNIARWGCLRRPICRPDVNGDGELDILDFLDSFAHCQDRPAPCAGSSGVSADYNGDTTIDILDFLDFFDAFGAGC